MRLLVIASLILLPFLASRPASASINPAFEYTGSAIGFDPGAYTIGFEFSLSQSFDVNALGYFSQALATSQQVGIWDSVSDLLTSTTVTSSDPTVGHFDYAPVSLVLGPGTYTIAGTFSDNSVAYLLSGVTSMPGYSWITDEQTSGFGLHYPTDSTGGLYGANGIAQVDFSVVAATPEPGFYGTLLLGLSGLATAVGIARLSVESSGSQITHFTTPFSACQLPSWKASGFPAL